MNVSQVHPKRCNNTEINYSYICEREILAGYLRHISPMIHSNINILSINMKVKYLKVAQ